MRDSIGLHHQTDDSMLAGYGAMGFVELVFE